MNQTARAILAVHLTMMFQMILIIFGALNFHARMCFIFIPATIQGNVLFSTYLLVAMEHMNGLSQVLVLRFAVKGINYRYGRIKSNRLKINQNRRNYGDSSLILGSLEPLSEKPTALAVGSSLYSV